MYKRTPISTIDLDLTNNCVLACDYCFRGEKNRRRLTLDVGKKAIDWFIKESGNQKKLMVALFGGEPLMEFELIKELVPYAKDAAKTHGKSIHFSATTNCVLIDDEKIAFWRKYGMTFHTSIDGSPESHDKHRVFPNGKGSSAIVEANVKKVLKYWPGRTARMTVSNDNIHRWMEDVNYLVGLGYKNLAMIPVPELDWTEEHFKIMQREMRKISDFYIERHRQGKPIYIKHLEGAMKGIVKPKRRQAHCGAGRGYVLIKTDGTIYPCHRFGGDIDAESQQKWKLGTIFDGWKGNKREELLAFDCRKNVKADCENCVAVHTCGTTCIAVSWSCFKDIYKPHPNQCRFTKMYFAEAMRVHYILHSEENPSFMKKFYPSQAKKNAKKINGQRNSMQSQKHVALPEVVFVALSSHALSPCFMFNGNNHKTETQLSMEKLKSTLKWATKGGNMVPNLFFLVGKTEKLETSVAKFLERVPEQILVPLVPRQMQDDLQVPFSEKQVVIASSLKQLVSEKENIHNRPVIVHVYNDEIEQMADLLLSIKDSIPQITLRLRNANQLTDDQIEMYQKQLSILRDVLSLNNTLKLGGISKVHSNGVNGQNRCPAGRQLVTIGTDGLAYPCPTFYRSGLNGRPLDSLNVSASHFSMLDTEPGCICDSEKCPGCEYVKLSGDHGINQVCSVYKAQADK